MIVTITGLDRDISAIAAIKSLRTITHSSLHWAKVEVYDKVRAGEEVPNVDLDSLQDIEYLRSFGWKVRIDDEGMSPVIIAIPAQHKRLLMEFVEALGGSARTN